MSVCAVLSAGARASDLSVSKLLPQSSSGCPICSRNITFTYKVEFNKSDCVFFIIYFCLYVVCARLVQLVRSLTANQEVPGSSPDLVVGLNFGRPSFATPSVDRDVKLLV